MAADQFDDLLVGNLACAEGLDHQRHRLGDADGVGDLYFATVGQARGVILLTAQQAGIPILEFSPLQVKQGVTGYGRATKEQVIDMTMRLLGIRQKIKPDDAADGLAMAIYAIYSSHSMSLKRKVQL